MIIRLIGFILLTALNGYVTYQLWDALWISKLPLCFLVLSYLCGALFLIKIKEKTQRVLTYTFTVTIFVFGIIYALYFRRPLGFYTAFSSAILFAKNFITGPNSKDKHMAKIVNAVLLMITAATLTVTTATFSSAIRDPLANGAGVLWTSQDENYFDEIATGTTEEEKVKSVYTWMTKNITYDYNYDCLYQYSNITKTLQTQTGVCYDISCLFAAICRSQDIPCYVIDGYSRINRSIQHTWNRVYIDGVWYDVDVTNDLSDATPYGFHLIADYNSEDKDYVIMRIY
ncbi:MAG: transglutaminase domain-containing protein [Oscillospiraceae bacterium]|nr:transglutaminase domain-containing protein [Oscillospiraceae bacterium]